MDDEHIYVAMLKNSEPEKFLFVTLDADRVFITRTSYDLSQGEMERALHKMGIPWDEIKTKIEHARKQPV